MTHRLAPLASVCAGALLALGMASAHAAPITYRVITGTDATPANTVRAGQAPVSRRVDFIAALDARTRFENFESFGVGQATSLSLFRTPEPGLEADLAMVAPPAPAGSFGRVIDTGAQGRFDTSDPGSKWWEASGNFSISFDRAIEAFAFYATDLGDFEAALTIEWFLDKAAAPTEFRGMEYLRGSGVDGALDFWGLTDTGGFNRVSFTIGQRIDPDRPADVFDFIGFDDLIAGFLLRAAPEPPPQGVPEPLTLALVGLGLAGIALTRRRRR